ncbi:hypothetical protein [Sporosarcina sp. ITBMC105]
MKRLCAVYGKYAAIEKFMQRFAEVCVVMIACLIVFTTIGYGSTVSLHKHPVKVSKPIWRDENCLIEDISRGYLFKKDYSLQID